MAGSFIPHPQARTCWVAPMTNPIRNETSLVLGVAVVFSAIAIPALSGFLEPSQPPAVGAVQIGQPRDGANAVTRDDGAPDGAPDPNAQPERQGEFGEGPSDDTRRRPAPQRSAPAVPAQPDDAAEDDGGEAD
jgi:hypothetical protein